MAASATFALKNELCIPRARLAIVALDSRHVGRSPLHVPLIGLSKFFSRLSRQEHDSKQTFDWPRFESSHPDIKPESVPSLLEEPSHVKTSGSPSALQAAFLATACSSVLK